MSIYCRTLYVAHVFYIIYKSKNKNKKTIDLYIVHYNLLKLLLTNNLYFN